MASKRSPSTSSHQMVLRENRPQNTLQNSRVLRFRVVVLVKMKMMMKMMKEMNSSRVWV